MIREQEWAMRSYFVNLIKRRLKKRFRTTEQTQSRALLLPPNPASDEAATGNFAPVYFGPLGQALRGLSHSTLQTTLRMTDEHGAPC